MSPSQLSGPNDAGKSVVGAAVSCDVYPLPPVDYEETTVRIELKDAKGSVTGYDDVTSGLGYTYTTHYDAALNYLGSDYVEQNGYRSSSSQTTKKDGSGNITGYLIVSSGDSADYSYESSDEYDANWSLIQSKYSDSQGYASKTNQSVNRDGAGTITGYTIISTGGDSTSQYTSTTTYDAAWNMIQSAYSDGAGYHSTYSLQTQYDSAGKVTGYVATSMWTDGFESYTSVQHYDAEWNWLDPDPTPIVDEGVPVEKPVLMVVSADRAEAALENMSISKSGNEGLTVADTPGVKDVLQGSAGSDVFIISDRSDRIAKQGGGGTDTIASSVFDLDLGRRIFNGIENAGLLGDEDLDLKGDGGDNLLSGNAGDNLIAGKGGADTLFGGAGRDVFMLDKFNLKHADSIIDFSVGTDTIGLSKRSFGKLMGDDGKLVADAWGDTLRFDAKSGALILDTPKGEITIALVANVNSLSAESFGFY